jgi:hypothetical protein
VLIVDTILLSPFRGLGFILRQIHQAVGQEQEGEADRLRAELSALYLLLETNRITEGEFSAQEAALLDRLDRLEAEDTDDGEPPQTDS